MALHTLFNRYIVTIVRAFIVRQLLEPISIFYVIEIKNTFLETSKYMRSQ